MVPIAPASRLRAPDRTVRLVEVASRQGGVVARRQLRELGFGDGTVARWVAAGRLIRVHPAVYAVGHTAIGVYGQLVAGLLYAGPGSALTGRTGSRLWDVARVPWTPIHIAAPTDRRSLPGVIVHRPRRFERLVHRGLPVTPLVDCLLGLAQGVSDVEVRRALAQADYRHKLDPAEVRRALGRGRRGAARLRRAVDHHLPELGLTNSPLEEELMLLCEREGLPIPEPNARVGPYRVDALWREARLVAELDGGDAHSSEARRMIDHERDMYLRASDHAVVRYSKPQLRRRPRDVAAELRGLIATRTAGTAN